MFWEWGWAVSFEVEGGEREARVRGVLEESRGWE